jgi:hypothetical protein
MVHFVRAASPQWREAIRFIGPPRRITIQVFPAEWRIRQLRIRYAETGALHIGGGRKLSRCVQFLAAPVVYSATGLPGDRELDLRQQGAPTFGSGYVTAGDRRAIALHQTSSVESARRSPTRWPRRHCFD